MKKSIKSKNIIIKTASDIFMPLGLMFGIYVILHGHLSPGGGFQGGVVVASAVVLVYLGYGHAGLKKVFNLEALKVSETLGAIIYSGFALIGIIFGFAFARNIFVDFGIAGNPGDLYSTGTIFWMNLSVGFKVLTGVGFLILFMIGLMAKSEEKE